MERILTWEKVKALFSYDSTLQEYRESPGMAGYSDFAPFLRVAVLAVAHKVAPDTRAWLDFMIDVYAKSRSWKDGELEKATLKAIAHYPYDLNFSNYGSPPPCEDGSICLWLDFSLEQVKRKAEVDGDHFHPNFDWTGILSGRLKVLFISFWSFIDIEKLKNMDFRKEGKFFSYFEKCFNLLCLLQQYSFFQKNDIITALPIVFKILQRKLAILKVRESDLYNRYLYGTSVYTGYELKWFGGLSFKESMLLEKCLDYNWLGDKHSMLLENRRVVLNNRDMRFRYLADTAISLALVDLVNSKVLSKDDWGEPGLIAEIKKYASILAHFVGRFSFVLSKRFARHYKS